MEEPRLLERVEHALRSCPYGALRGVTVAVRCRQVTLQGSVPSYYMKQIAQTAVSAVPGVARVRNEIEVT